MEPENSAFEKVAEQFANRFAEVREFRRMLTYESHRGCALAAAAFLDERLKQLLQASFVERCGKSLLDGQNAPLSTFSARILAAEGLGLIPPKAARDLNLIRKIRNEFAHRLDCDSFDDPQISSLCRELCYCFSNPHGSARSRFTNATSGVLALIDAKTAFATRPVQPEDSTREVVAQNFEQAKRLELATQENERAGLMQKLGISDSTSIIDLLELAARCGLLESQPPRENLLVLETLEQLIVARAQADAGQSAEKS